MTKNKETKVKKILGASKYAGSKKKSKSSKIVKDKVVIDKNRSLKLKIKNLQKELGRIDNSATDLSNDKKISAQKKLVLEKLNKLLELLKKYTKI